MTMILRVTLPLAYALLLVGCQNTSARGPIINSASYDWTDEVRDARGFPVPGWGWRCSGRADRLGLPDGHFSGSGTT